MAKRTRFLFTICSILCIFSSCENEESRWDKTKDGIQIYHNYGRELLSIPSIEWSGDTTYYGLAHGKGVFKFKDKNYEKNNITKKVYAHYGSIENIENLSNYQVGPTDKEGRLDGFGVRVIEKKTIIGNAKKGEFKGEGVILINDTLYYKGDLKESLPHGEGTSYYSDGNVHYTGDWKKGKYDGKGVLYALDGNVLYNGKWKKGNYNGLGTLYQNGKPITHVWDNGSLDKASKEYYALIKENANHFTPEYMDKLIARGLSWEKYHIWYYITIWASLAIILCIMIAITDEEKSKDPFMNLKPWKLFTPYALWLLFGTIGAHRASLKSYGVYIYLCTFATIVCFETRDICHFLFWPSTWFMWKPSVVTMWAIGLIGVMLLFDLVWIPWRCYILNFNYFRKDRYEVQILKNNLVLAISQTYTRLPGIVNRAATEFPQNLRAANKIQQKSYSGDTGFLARTGRVLKGDSSGVEFEITKLKEIESVRNKAVKLHNELARISKDLNLYLLQSRASAYRNLYLAKELISKIKFTKGQEQKLQTDISLDEREIAILQNLSNYIDTNVSMDWEATINMSIDNANMLMDSGLKTGWAIGVGVAASLVGNAMNALQKEQKAREAAVNVSAEVVSHLDEITKEITKNQSRILRTGEILEALYNANKAFVHAYVPLRDQIYGETPSIKGFLNNGKPSEDLIKDTNFIQSVRHLAQVCSEYNKINKIK